MKVTKVYSDSIFFNDGSILKSEHDQSCCESHYLDFSNLSIDDFEGLEFDLTNDNFFDRIVDFGIALKPTNGHPIRIPGYGSNNGYYSTDLDLIIKNKDKTTIFNITECQEINCD